MNRPRILVVDDNPTNLSLFLELLDIEGYDVRHAGDAESAIQVIAAWPPNLILMDIGLPGMDGLTLTRHLRSHPLTRDVHIIAVTASAMKGDREKALAAGCDRYVTKPIDTRTFPAEIAEVLGRTRAPLSTPALAPGENFHPTPSARKPSPGGPKILVADDVEANRLVLRGVLEADGYAVIEAADGAAVLDLLRETQVAAVISDVLMPNMDGFRLCIELRKTSQWRSLPFMVYTSTYNSPADRVLAEKAGADAYLVKPAPAAAVISALREAIAKAARRPADTAPVTIDEADVLKQYNTALVRKLEEKNTELARAITGLKEREARFRQLAENIHEVFWLTEPDKQTMLYISPAYEKIWGRSIAALCESPTDWLDAIHPDDRERISNAAYTKQVAGTYNEEYRIVRPDGTVRWIRDRAFPVRDEHGVLIRMAGIAEDITERKELESHVARAQRLDAIGSLASGVAHDLNNMLAPIMMAVPLLRMGLSGTERDRLFETIEASVQRGAAMVRRLLTFGRGVEGEPRLIRPIDAVREVGKFVNESFPKNITLKDNSSPHAWTIHADVTQLHQVLLNLCVNARDAMPNGGTLTISTNNVTLDEHEARMTPGATARHYVMFTVTDTGLGISPEIMDRIFDPFFTTKEVGKGTGLGLAMVMAIAKSHRGFVRAESKPGRGSSFHVYLPMTGYGDDAPKPSQVTLPPRGNGEVILIVDDEEHIRETLRQTLVRHGYQVLTAADGAQATAIYANRRADIRVVIGDLEMPVMDGIMMVQVMQRINPQVRVIVSSGVSSAAALSKRRAQLESLGVDSILAKPYDAEKILSAIHRSL